MSRSQAKQIDALKVDLEVNREITAQAGARSESLRRSLERVDVTTNKLRDELTGEQKARAAAEEKVMSAEAVLQELLSQRQHERLQREQMDEKSDAEVNEEAPAPTETATPPAPDDRPDRELAISFADGDVVKARGILRFLQGEDVEPEPDHQPSVSLDTLRMIIDDVTLQQKRYPRPVPLRLQQVLDAASAAAS